MFTTAMVTGRTALVSTYKGYEYERHIQLHVPQKGNIADSVTSLNHK